MKLLTTTVFVSASVLLVSNVWAGGNAKTPTDYTTLGELEKALTSQLADAKTDTDFTLLLKSANGHEFRFSRGDSSPEKVYESASTSKLVTAAVIMRLVEQGKLRLDSHPQDFIPSWPADGSQSHIELQHLLNFTSGLKKSPPCSNLGKISFETCTLRTLSFNGQSPEPGRQFYYDSTHMQIAGLMAVKAAGVADWGAVFDDFRHDTGLFAKAAYDLPAPNNPRLAGGMHWSGAEYLDFLDALYHGKVVTPATLQQMITPQTLQATVQYSPAKARIEQNWPYGFGVWIECEPKNNGCAGPQRVSSPGAYGAYPFMDFRHQYVGILARQGGLKTFDRGYQFLDNQSAWLERWANLAANTPN